MNLIVDRAHIRRNFFVVPLHLLAIQAQLSFFCERFRNGQYSLVSFLFAVLLLTRSPCPAISKSGGTCPMESAPLFVTRRCITFIKRTLQKNTQYHFDNFLRRENKKHVHWLKWSILNDKRKRLGKTTCWIRRISFELEVRKTSRKYSQEY